MANSDLLEWAHLKFLLSRAEYLSQLGEMVNEAARKECLDIIEERSNTTNSFLKLSLSTSLPGEVTPQTVLDSLNKFVSYSYAIEANVKPSVSTQQARSHSPTPSQSSSKSSSSDAEIKQLGGCLPSFDLSQEMENLNFGGGAGVRLPIIELPTFSDSSFSSWINFKSLFQSLIVDNSKLSPVHKLLYLKSCLKGQPLKLVESIELEGKNFTVAWSILLKKYDNARLSATKYLNELLDCKNIVKSSELENLLTHFTTNVEALRLLGFPVDSWDLILTNLVLRKVDYNTRQSFENDNDHDLPKFEDLIKFLEKRVRALKSTELLVSKPMSIPSSSKNNPTSLKNPSKSVFLNTSSSSCAACSETHALYTCKKFLSLKPLERYKFVKEKGLCVLCLSSAHKVSKCPREWKCKVCKHMHNSLLHYSNGNSEASTQEDSYKTTSIAPASMVGSQGGCHKRHPQVVLLSTLLVAIKKPDGSKHVTRALLDSGSECSFVTTQLANDLGWKKSFNVTPIRGLSNNTVTKATGPVKFTITPFFRDNPALSISALCIERISGNLPSVSIPPTFWPHFEGVQLADPGFGISQPVSMLLGADVLPQLLLSDRRFGPPNTPLAVETTFGYVILGPATEIASPQSVSVFHAMSHETSCQQELNDIVKSFWEIEQVPNQPVISKEDEMCEKTYQNFVERTSEGRYKVPLTFRSGEPELGDSRLSALKRFHSLEQRLTANPVLYQKYSDFLKMFLNQGYMEEVSDVTTIESSFYLPHHCVIKESTTTDLRVVFDAAARSTNGRSLNNCLLPGPKLQNNLTELLVKFRTSPIALVGDIRKMFLQILLHEPHTDYQLILWRFHQNEDIKTYRLKTVTFGLNCSPYLAIRTLHQLSRDEGDNFPLGASALVNDFYVDDLLSCTPDINTAKQTVRELRELLSRGGFSIEKWCSNSVEALDELPDSAKRNVSVVEFDSDSNFVKVLGLNWEPMKDIFSYQVRELTGPETKRGVLSSIAKIFDPLGWLSPIIIVAKLLLQEIWKRELDWDDPLPPDVVQSWNNFRSDVHLCNHISVPRPIYFNKIPQAYSLHGFCDASLNAYASVAYIVVSYPNQPAETFLLAAKSKIAPAKGIISLARLELLGAVLLTQLLRFCLKALQKLELSIVACWSDSMITLQWINSDPARWQTFVAHRVQKIQEGTNTKWWRYVPSALNPADCASRGITPKELMEHQLWWNGPEFLTHSSTSWPESPVPISFNPTELEERKTNAVHCLVSRSTDFDYVLQFYSHLLRLQRVTAYLFRAVTLRNVRNSGPLRTSELKNSLTFWIKFEQAKHFAEVIANIKSGKPLVKTMARFSPFIDDEGVLRVGGRLQNSDLSVENCHPILLPQKSHLSLLIVRFYHTSFGHLGPGQLQAAVMRRFWIISARRLARSVYFNCVECYKLKPKLAEAIMGNLPTSRVLGVRPFLKTGVDFAGPLLVKSSNLRKAPIEKAYVAVFVCMATKACHLELVSSLSTRSFLNALDRFVARRGLCREMHSDNGTNFVGANNELKKFLTNSKVQEVIADYATTKEINWIFIPPSAPHFGGLWEATVKSMKTNLLKIVGNISLTFEELYTVLTKVEAMLNSRPLTQLSTDPKEFDILTPGHFLVFSPLTAVPGPDFSDHQNLQRLKRWELLLQLQRDIWKRWSAEYLSSLQVRSRWTKSSPNIREGALVLVKEDNLSPLSWPRGRISKCHSGKDNVVRVVDILIPSGKVIRRPITKVAPLPIS